VDLPSSTTSTYNSYKKIQEDSINGRIVVQPHVWYTCPTGKKAIIKGQAVCTGTGAAANTTLQGADETIRRVLSSGGSTDRWQRDLVINLIFTFEIELNAGETLETIQNTGTNAEWEVIAQVLETSA